MSRTSNGREGEWRVLKFENDKTGLEAIKMSYINARDANPDPVGVSIGKDRRKERRKAEERERQLQEEIEEERQKVNERDRQIEEERRKVRGGALKGRGGASEGRGGATPQEKGGARARAVQSNVSTSWRSLDTVCDRYALHHGQT